MRKLWLVILGLAVGCGDSSGPDAAVAAELVGEWVAEPACAPPCSFTLTWVENPLAKLDAVVLLGLTVRIDVTSSGRFTLSGAVAESGTVRTEGSTMLVTSGVGAVDTIDWSIRDGNLHLDFRREYAVISFDPPNTDPDPAHVTGVFRRR
jgi:hypothetical protein